MNAPRPSPFPTALLLQCVIANASGGATTLYMGRARSSAVAEATCVENMQLLGGSGSMG